jgi:two-component sensor histidine kinase
MLNGSQRASAPPNSISRHACPDANAALQNASARVHAIAAVHEKLYTGKDVRVVSLDVFLDSLCSNIGDAL